VEKVEKVEKVEECVELKNIKYKTMLLNGGPSKETKSSNDLTNLDKFLEDNKNNFQNEPWCKLDKTIKTKKLLAYADNYTDAHQISADEKLLLIAFLKDCLDRKKLQRVKDVEYNKLTGEIIDIPALFYTKSNKHFTLKNLEKRVSTLKSLPPKKVKTIKNKTHPTTASASSTVDEDDDDADIDIEISI
jgi:hypothetical protein